MAQYVEVNGHTIEFPDGMAAPDIEAAIKANYLNIPKAKPAAVQAGGVLNEIPRQVGLTARYGIEGLANAAQIVTEPIRYLQDKVTPERAPSMSDLVTGERKPKSLPLGMIATQFADRIGLPSPRDANERTIAEATKFVAGGALPIGVANRGADVATGVAREVFTKLAANPTSQLTAAAGGGLASGASREAGGSDTQQGLATVLGTFAGGIAPGAMSSLATRLSALRAPPMQLEGRVSTILRESGVDWGQMPQNVRNQLLADVRRASTTGESLNADALRRLADFRLTGTTPTRGGLTLDPVQITREQNLAKLGANTADDALQGLARTQNQNNTRLIDNLNDLGASTGNVDAAGARVTSAITGRQAGLRGAEQTAWDAAKGSPGYRQPISSHVISDINQALGDEGLMPFMNPTISKYMEAFQTGQPFTPQAYRNLQSMLSREVAKGGNEGAAANLARRVLERSDIQPITNPGGIDFRNLPSTPQMAAAMRQVDAAPASSIDAVNQARAATRAAYAYEDSSPLVRSVLSDGASADPQRIAKRFIVNGTTNEARVLAQEVGPTGIGTIKNALLAHLKSKAVSGAADEVGKFSQSAFNKAMREIGDDKLRVFFTPEEIAQLHANGRVASYMQVQPVGSAVNNSNSGALMLGKGYDLLNSVVGSLPGGRAFVMDPLRNIDITLSQRQAQNLTPSLLNPSPRQAAPTLLGPAVSMGGLLAAPRPVGE
jgi:hypothetical protein